MAEFLEQRSHNGPPPRRVGLKPDWPEDRYTYDDRLIDPQCDRTKTV
jgi:hypothetical protein